MSNSIRLLLASSLMILSALGLSGLYGSCTLASGDEYPYLTVQFVNSTTGWIVGSRLLHTTDGGRTWQVIQQDGDGTLKTQTVVTDLHRYQFINQEVGVTWLGNVFKRTTDGGRTWQESFVIPPEDQYQWLSFFFLSPKEGWAAGKFVHYTKDGGKNWQELSKTPLGDYWRQRRVRIDSEMANYLPVIRFTNAKHGLMVKLDGLIFLTQDGGKTWQSVFQIDKKLQDVFFSGEQDGWAVGDTGTLARTTDGGRNWVHIQTPTDKDLYGVFFINSKLGCVVGSGCTVLCTKDGGSTWTMASVKGVRSPPSPLVSVSFTDELHGWAVGGFGKDSISPLFSSSSSVVLFTKDGGQNWEAIDPLHR